MPQLSLVVKACRKGLHTYPASKKRCPACYSEWQKTAGAPRRQAFFARHPNYSSEWAKKQGYRAQKAWKARNPHKVNSCTRVRQARIKTSCVEFVDYAQVIQRAEGRCQICREPFGLVSVEIDHIIPLSKGGTHTYDNVQAAHASCNRRKSAKLDFAIAV